MSHRPRAGAAPQSLLNKSPLSPSPWGQACCAHCQTPSGSSRHRHRSGVCPQHWDVLPSPPDPAQGARQRETPGCQTPRLPGQLQGQACRCSPFLTLEQGPEVMQSWSSKNLEPRGHTSQAPSISKAPPGCSTLRPQLIPKRSLGHSPVLGQLYCTQDEGLR